MDSSSNPPARNKCILLNAAGRASYLGCFLDNLDPRRLATYQNAPQAAAYFASGRTDGSSISLDACLSAALDGSFTVFGMVNGAECWLGYDQNSAMTLGAAQNCILPCAGNKGQICGGEGAISLYGVQGVFQKSYRFYASLHNFLRGGRVSSCCCVLQSQRIKASKRTWLVVDNVYYGICIVSSTETQEKLSLAIRGFEC